MSSRVFEWTRSLRTDKRASNDDRSDGYRVLNTLARSVASATSAGVREAAERDVAELTRQEEAKLIQRVFLAPQAPRAVLFAGVERDSGSAHVCLRMGHALARMTRRPVCVVDADLRAPQLHDLTGTEVREGLAEAIANSEAASSFARRLTPDLWLLPAGSAPYVDSLASVDQMRACVQELGTQFQHVVISAPAIDDWAESLTVSRVVDGMILVLRAHVTRREIVRHLKARLDALDTPLLGVVLNDRTFPIPEAVYRLL